MNIRYSPAILQACQAADLRIAQRSRRDEPVGAKIREGSTLAWGVAEAIQGIDTIPDIIYDLGEVGQEAMVWVLGHDALAVARKTLTIRHRLLGH
jgi:hydroxymethylpyrimidine/phosphomethylpyrimidine kinase